MANAHPAKANRNSMESAANGRRPAVTAMARRFIPKLARRPGRFLPPSAGGPARRPKGRPARVGAGALAALLCMALLSVALPDRARAQTDTTLVSNLGQLFGGTTLVGNVAGNTATQAQRFTTGGTIADSFTLSKAVINMGTQTGTLTLRVSIYSADASDNPGSSLYVLTNPASISQTANNTFTAPVGSTLTGGTDYFIVLERTASTGGINVTTTGSLDQEGLDGWTVADERHWKLGGEAWQTSTSIIRFSLVSTPDARLSTLVLSVDGTTVPGLLSPAFDPDVTEYTASVENSVDKIGVDVTLSDATATSDMFDADGMAITLVDDQVSLVVGANVIDVEVTAHDGTTTKTYRVTVTRAGALPLTNLAAAPGDGQVALSWDAPASDSGVTRHEYRYKAEGGSYPSTWTEIPNSAAGGANEDGVTVSGLTNGTVYTFQVRAVDAVGEGASAESTDVTPYSTDATLSALTLADGTTNIVLNPAFASGTRNYAAVVANSVDSVTVSATTSHASARFDLLDANDEEIDDADANRSGYQVSLGTGTNTIKVKVTAEDGSTTRTYRLRVTRLTATGGGTGSCATTLPDEIWCATLTVGTGSRTVSGVTINYTGFRNLTGLNVGGLDPDSFEYQGDTYTVPGVFLVTSAFIDDVLGLSLDPVPTGANAGRWILYVGTTAYELPQATNLVDNGQPTFTWTDLPSWSDGETVTVRLTAPSTDATLSGLTLTDGTTNVPLTPAFASATTGYTASVANSVTQITVTPEPNDGGASYELLDASGMAISDADSSTLGDQVMLSVGANIIKVKVTAADGTTGTYTVTVTRSQGPAVVLEPTVLHIAEGGSGSYTVRLNSAPTGTVTVLLTVTGDTDVTVQPSVLSFTTSDWATPQPVTVTAGLDDDDDTDTATIAHQPHGGGYDGLARSVRVTVSDAEGSGVGRLQLAGNLETGEEVVNGETVPYTKGRLEIWMRGALNPDSNRWEASYGGTVLAGAAQGAWGTVCDDRFRQPDNRAADVACKIMGYEGGAYASGYGSNMSLADKAIWLDDVRCLAGTPSHRVDDPRSLLDCNHGGRGYHNCSHREDVGLKCTGMLGTLVDSGPELRAATLVDDRQAVLLGFDEALDADNLPPTGAFRVFVVDHNDDTRLVTGLGAPAENLLQLRLDLHKPVPGGKEVKVIYEDPTSGDDGEAIQDGDGNDAHAFRVVTESGSASTAGDGPLSDEAETGLAAEFKDLPASHDGEAPFTFELALSEDIEGLSWVTVRDSVLDVSGGRVTQARRLEAPSNRRWAVTVEPVGDGEISIALPPTTDCEAEGALCTADGRMLANGRATLVPGPQAAPAPEPEADLTVRFESVPDTHDGESPVVFRLAFSEEPASGYSYVTMRDRTLNVWQGSRLEVKRARRLSPPSNRRWEATVDPVSKADNITVGLGPTFDCADNGAVCTEDGRKLANQVHKVIKGPPGISVADARVEEAADATVDFAVSLSRAASETVTVQYATSDGTATAGSDYTQTSGTLTFTEGESSKTISVPVLDDAHDEGEETFTLTLSNASGGGAWLKDATATGTIENTDAMPSAWLVRFGRTVASQAVDAIGGRMEGAEGSHVTVGGMQLDGAGKLVKPEEKTSLGGDFESLRWNPIDETRAMTSRELVLGSSFRLSAGGENGAPSWTGWGHFATGGFEADVKGTRMDGDVTTGFLGADVGADRWLAGIALSLTEGDGDFSLLKGDDKGTVESSLSALYPYAKLGVSDTVDVWGLVGFGSGELELTLLEDANRMQDETYKTDIGMRMGALGVRGEVLSPADSGGLSVAVKSDAFWVRTDSDAVEPNQRHGKLAASEADASRVRLIVEGSRAFDTGNGTLTPSAEVGVRYDGGDAETGTGIELGGALRYQGSGVTIEGAVRTLIAHEESGYEEWGASGAIRIQPGSSGRGLSFTLSPTWGAASSGVGRLWGLRDAQGLASDGEFEAESRLEAEIGYGIGVPHSRGLVTPYTALSLAEGGSRTWRNGARWKVAPDSTLGLEATRQEGRGDETAENAIVFRVQTRW